MAVMPDVTYLNREGGGRYIPPNPIGCILHKTENPRFQQSARSFVTTDKYPHLLVGKSGEIAQMCDTSRQAVHVGNANAYYIGIEISSIESRFPHRQDPETTRDPLTPAQVDSLRRVVDWVSQRHSIPKVGPPSSREMKDAEGHWHGFCSHADVSLVITSKGDHEEGVTDEDFMALGIYPATSRQGESSLTELLRRQDYHLLSPLERAKADVLSGYLRKLGKSITSK